MRSAHDDGRCILTGPRKIRLIFNDPPRAIYRGSVVSNIQTQGAGNVSRILAHAPELQTPLTVQLVRSRPIDQDNDWCLDVLKLYHNTLWEPQAFCMEREGPKSTSTNEGDRWKSECATFTFWS